MRAFQWMPVPAVRQAKTFSHPHVDLEVVQLDAQGQLVCLNMPRIPTSPSSHSLHLLLVGFKVDIGATIVSIELPLSIS